MFAPALLCAGLLAVAPEASKPPVADPLSAYRAEAARVGRDPEANVKLALWCEAHGLEPERLKHLAIASVTDPVNAAARGLMGLVKDGDAWRRPEQVAERVARDEALSSALAEYNARRAKTPNTADAQWRLALWCEEKGLKPEAMAHLGTVVQLDPSRDAAWRKLGFKKRNGRWATDEQVAAAKAEAEAQEKADRHWRQRFEECKEKLRRGGLRAEAERELAKVTDPRAVPSIWRVFILSTPANPTQAVQLLGQIDGQPASQALAILAVFAPLDETRRAAAETLRRRDPREFVDLLIGFLRVPHRFEVRPVAGPGSVGALFVEGERYNILRHYQPPDLPQETKQFIEQAQANVVAPVSRNELGMVSSPQTLSTTLLRRQAMAAQNISEAQRAAVSAERQLENDVAQVEAENAEIANSNQNTLAVLTAATGQDFQSDREAWKAWWTDQKGYSYQSPRPMPRPTFQTDVQLAYQPTFAASHGSSCFAAGTMVKTLGGQRAIETLKVGDRVLTQNVETGALSFQPVVVVKHNPPASTLHLSFGDEAIVSTGIHRFWKAGAGWAMARELKPGDLIRTVGGTARLEKVESASLQPVFNLEVPEGHSFFVGRRGALVHDNSLVQPVSRAFDAAESEATRLAVK